MFWCWINKIWKNFWKKESLVYRFHKVIHLPEIPTNVVLKKKKRIAHVECRLLSSFRFWKRLSRFMSKVNPEPNLIHIMGCYVLGNPNGEKVCTHHCTSSCTEPFSYYYSVMQSDNVQHICFVGWLYPLVKSRWTLHQVRVWQSILAP